MRVGEVRVTAEVTPEGLAALAAAFLGGEATLGDLRGAVADSTRDLNDSGWWTPIEMAVLEGVSEEALRELIRDTLEGRAGS